MQSADEAIVALRVANPKYVYDETKFPGLKDTRAWSSAALSYPTDLAEALLWKLGKWKAYREFVANYIDEVLVPKSNGVVFFAFARHLKSEVNPIFDQHSLRAIWAICSCISPSESESIKRWLMSKKEKWKEAGAGPTGIHCYDIFREQLKYVAREGVDFRHLDHLLMPLGQAIKQVAPTYREFVRLVQ